MQNSKLKSIILKLSSFLHLRLIVSCFVLYILFKSICVDLIFNNIKKETSADNIVNKINETIKEGKETLSMIQKITKSIGIENIPSVVTSETSKNTLNNASIVLKMENVSISEQNFKKMKRVIPLCNSNIDAKIIAKNQKGEVFFDDNISFKLGDFSLPFGLEKSIQKMTSGFQYNAIVPLQEVFFLDKPNKEMINLKPKNNSKFVSYSVIFDKIDKSIEVGGFEPRIFYITTGKGNEVVCNSSIKATIKVMHLDGGLALEEKDYSINIGSGDIPYGLEHILMRLKTGDKISVMLNQDWLRVEKKHANKIFLPKSEYLIFDITIQNVKHPAIMFKAMKPEISLED